MFLSCRISNFVLFDLATVFTKLSMLALVYRLCSSNSKTIQRIVIGLAILITTNGIIFLIVIFLQCRYVLSLQYNPVDSLCALLGERLDVSEYYQLSNAKRSDRYRYTGLSLTTKQTVLTMQHICSPPE
jgi:hypothetical protein